MKLICIKCGKAFNTKKLVKLTYQEYPGAKQWTEEVSPCCSAAYEEREQSHDRAK